MEPKQHCHFERRRCTREASAAAESRNLLFAGTQIDVGAFGNPGRLAENTDAASAVDKQQVPRLHKIFRFANDPAALGMTGLRVRRKEGVRRVA